MKRICSFALSIIIILSLTAFYPNLAYGTEKEAVRIAIIDTGISTKAIDEKNLDVGKNYIIPSASTEDAIGHGTSVSSIIVGSKSAGVTGLCPDAILVPLVYYTKTEDGDTIRGDLTMLAQMIRDAVDIYGCSIINISSGAKVDNPVLRDAVAWAEQNGVLVVSCAGNDGNDTVYYPGAFSTVLCAGTINTKEDGPAIFSNRHSGVDLLASGINIKTANLKGEAVTVNGTSFSTAWISGAAATMLSGDPTLTPYQLRQILCNTAKDICTTGYDFYSGWGIVDLQSALISMKDVSGALLPFNDVDEDSYYSESVSWALKNGITGGTSSTTFSPYMTCTRAQTVTFLWRAVGCPEPRIKNNPFTDVVETDYFYKAVLWATEKGITSGTSEIKFSPNSICTEAEIITFLWRSRNCPDVNGRSELAASLGEYYYTDAVAWADTYGLFLATGTDFIAKREVPRSNIVVYLYHSTANRH